MKSKKRYLPTIKDFKLVLLSIFIVSGFSNEVAASLPVVTAVEPSNGATGVGLETSVTATFNQPMDPNFIDTNSFSVSRNIGVKAIVTSCAHSLALRNDGTVAAWGDNYYGQSNVPSGLSDVIAVAAGSRHSVVLKNDSTVVAWGDNRYAQSTVPAGLSGVVAIAAGNDHTLALKSDGTVVAWGDNEYGQSSVPPNLSGVLLIVASGGCSMALRNDGTVVAWGDNTYGQCTIPSGLSGITSIAASGWHTVALKSDGTVVAWGDDWAGQATVPTGLVGVIAISAGTDHSVALKSDGTVVVWGDNRYGLTMVPSTVTAVTAIATGFYHSVALKSHGSVIAWGDNLYEQSSVPPDLSNVISISADGWHTVALSNDGTLMAWGADSDVPVQFDQDCLNGTVTYDQSTLSAKFMLSTELLPNTTYTAVINTDVRTLTGENLAKNMIWNFTTGSKSLTPPASGVTLTSIPSSSTTTGTSVTFTSEASGGSGSYQYKYLLRAPGGVLTTVRDYSATANWSWNTTGLAAGTYQVVVRVRNAGSTMDYETYKSINYYIFTAPASGVTLTSIPSSSTATGTSVTFTSEASGGSGSYQYKYLLRAPGGVLTTVRDYSATANWSWNTTGLAAGTYQVVVRVRNAGSTMDYETYKSINYYLTP
jgi:alpha-tubulin suppressor-like RCC1 family protein